MVKCLPEFEVFFYCVLEKNTLFLELEGQKLQTMQL